MSARPATAALLAAAMAMVPAAARAQWRAEATVGVRAVREASAAGRDGASVGGAATLEAGRLAAFGGALASDGGPRGGLATVDGGLSLRAWERGAWRAELGAEGGQLTLGPRLTGGDARGTARLRWTRAGVGGLWAEGGVLSAWRTAAGAAWDTTGSGLPRGDDTTLTGRARQRHDARTGNGVTRAAGGWLRARGVLLTATVRASAIHRGTETVEVTRLEILDSMRITRDTGSTWREDTVRWRDTVVHHDLRERAARLSQTDALLGASWRMGRLELEAASGVRVRALGFGGKSEPWGTAQAVLPLSPRVALQLRAARHAAEPLRGLPARRDAQLGLVVRPRGRLPRAAPPGVAPVARRFDTRREPDGRVTFRLRAPGARTVELMADFTAWRPLALRRDGDAWIATLVVPAGMHQLNVRIDGGDWAPPPGTTTADDGFGGRVGVVVVE